MVKGYLIKDKEGRNNRLVKLWNTGRYPVRSLAKMYRISESRVYAILERAKQKAEGK